MSLWPKPTRNCSRTQYLETADSLYVSADRMDEVHEKLGGIDPASAHAVGLLDDLHYWMVDNYKPDADPFEDAFKQYAEERDAALLWYQVAEAIQELAWPDVCLVGDYGGDQDADDYFKRAVKRLERVAEKLEKEVV